MDYADLTRRLRERTDPSSVSVARVRTRLDRALLPASLELGHLPPVSASSVARVKARLAQPERRPLPLAALGAGLAFAATSLGITAVGIAGWFALHHEEPVHARVSMAGAGVEHAAGGLGLTHDGQGAAVIDGSRARIDWEYGRLGLDAPTGLAVSVVTPEGAVEAGEGAALVVVRDPLGTSVQVDRGTASVSCGGDESRSVAAGSGEVSCDPLTATGWLTRARARQRSGPDSVLADLERGLALPDAVDAVRSELLALRTSTLVGAGRPADALASAEEALTVTTDPARAQDLHRTAARLALVDGDCARALPHLAALAEPTPEESSYAQRCQAR